MANFKRNGFGQVEPNHMSALRTGQIYAQHPCAESIAQLENGQFAKYFTAAGKGEVNTDSSAPGEWMMVYNEIKLYDERKQSLKDFAMLKGDYVDEEIVPRLFRVEKGDIFTTNTIGKAGAAGVDTDSTVADTTKYFTIGANGFLVASTQASDSPRFAVVDSFKAPSTMPDGQPAVKLVVL